MPELMLVGKFDYFRDSAFGLAIILFLLASFLAHSISNPLKEAADIIKGYSDKDGALDMRLPVKGDDEIAQLARALNHLADNLDSNILELNRSKKYLETIFSSSSTEDASKYTVFPLSLVSP